MCGGPERIKPSEEPLSPGPHNPTMRSPPNNLSVDVPDSSSSSSSSSSPSSSSSSSSSSPSHTSPSLLLELAANNDAAAIRRLLLLHPAAAAAADEEGVWYGRRKGTAATQMARELRTPLMVAATYGSVEALGVLLSVPSVNVNRRSSSDSATALHCAASSASPSAPSAVRLLLSSGADPSSLDSLGRLPSDLVLSLPHLPDLKPSLLHLLLLSPTLPHHPYPYTYPSSSSSYFPENPPPPLPLPRKEKEKERERENAGDPSQPDVKNSVYASDEFRMYSFKVRPCSRAYSHDWTECPFVHPGENARRRDPRKYHYSCMPCPDFRKGACRRGDMCEYAHGVFECWLHPAQYRTRICKDGSACSRRVCFFAHAPDELRPLFVSTGSAVPSPRSPSHSHLDFVPTSPSSNSSSLPVMPPPPPPLSPSACCAGWPQPSVPALHLPSSVLQSSRLRTSLSARDMQAADDFSSLMSDYEYDYDALVRNDHLSHSRLVASAGSNRMARAKTLAPSNLDDLFSAEIASSPNYSSDQGAIAIFSPSHKSAILHHQFQQQQQQQQNLLSPISTNVFSPKAGDAQQLPVHSALLQASLGIGSHGRMSPRSMEPISPLNSHFAALAQREKQQQTLRSLSSRDLGSDTSFVAGSPVNPSWPNWGLPSRAPDWEVNSEELGRLRRSSSFELRSGGGGGEEPDLSWVHSLVKESPPEKPVRTGSAHAAGVIPGGGGEVSNSNLHMGGLDQAADVGALLEKMQLERKGV